LIVVCEPTASEVPPRLSGLGEVLSCAETDLAEELSSEPWQGQLGEIHS